MMRARTRLLGLAAVLATSVAMGAAATTRHQRGALRTNSTTETWTSPPIELVPRTPTDAASAHTMPNTSDAG